MSLYRHSESVVTGVAWRLTTGVLVTGFNPEHSGHIDPIIAGVRVDDATQPRLSYDPPLTPGDARSYKQRDVVVLRAAADEQEETLNVERLVPGAPVGAAARDLGTPFVERSVTAATGSGSTGSDRASARPRPNRN